jgi:hypothetical protein
MRSRLMTGFLLLAGAAWAAGPEDFAWQWPLPLQGGEGLVSLTLDAEVYARLTRADLRDLAAFNGAGEMLPLAPLRPTGESEAPPPPPVEVPWFRVPADPSGGEQLGLRIARGPDGRLSRLEAEVAAVEGARGEDVLLDLSALERKIAGLRLRLALAPGEDLNARVDIEGSEDLSHWQRLVSAQALVDLRSGESRLVRDVVAFAPSRLPYLRIRRADGGAALPVEAVEALPASDAEGMSGNQSSHLVEVTGAAEQGTPGRFGYRLPGPLPVTGLNLRLAGRNGVAAVTLWSRDGEGASWRQRGRFTAFELEGAGVRNLPLRLPGIRDREWRLESEPALARAPVLEIEYRPDRYMLLAQGEAPFRLVAGSARVVRPDYPLAGMLVELRRARGQDWLPPEVRPGPGATLGGEAALRPHDPGVSLLRLLLWAVLMGGALLLLLMVRALLRKPA